MRKQAKERDARSEQAMKAMAQLSNLFKLERTR